MPPRVSPSVRALTRQRDGGWCPRRHEDGRKHAYELHHRRTAAMGGSKDSATHQASNLVWLCSACHLWVTDMVDRTLAEHEGYYVRQGQDPAKVPLLWRGEWVFLRHDGETDPTKEPA